MLRIEDELKNNQISRFQLLYGEERYMVRYYRNQLIEKLSNPDDEMNRTFFRDKPEPSQIAEAAQILPFFAENRLMVESRWAMVMVVRFFASSSRLFWM